MRGPRESSHDKTRANAVKGDSRKIVLGRKAHVFFFFFSACPWSLVDDLTEVDRLDGNERVPVEEEAGCNPTNDRPRRRGTSTPLNGVDGIFGRCILRS